MAVQNSQGELTKGKPISLNTLVSTGSKDSVPSERFLRLNDFIDNLNKLVATAAVIVAGIWTYKLFVEHREAYARANLQHDVTVVNIDDERRLLRLDVIIENTGNIMLQLLSAEVRIESVLPLSPRIEKSLSQRVGRPSDGPDFFPWPAIRVRHSEWDVGEFELEPGESDDTHYEFIIPASYKVVNIYTHFDNPEKQDKMPGIGWDHATLVDLR